MVLNRRGIYVNEAAKTWRTPSTPSGSAGTPGLATRFHRMLPEYAPTPLISLPSVAKEAGVKAVHIKFEGERLGLPAFKILGASWATFRALTKKLGLPLDSDLDSVKAALAEADQPVTLFAATDGNHGRAVARMASLFGIAARIYVPRGLHRTTVENIAIEGGVVTEVDGDYDFAVQATFDDSGKTPGGLVIQDAAYEGYEEIPAWVVEGYDTMMVEIDEQLPQPPTWVIAPVGVGSFAQAVVAHYKAPGQTTSILTVEPDTADCLHKSLTSGTSVPIETPVPTIMAGLNCGTVSEGAWPSLKAGVDASLTLSDFESHRACEILSSLGVEAGPCGAAPLAALRHLRVSEKERLGIDEESVIVLLCTEGRREYVEPLPVDCNDTVSLCQALVRIDSSIPGTGLVPGSGEVDIARFITAWLQHRDIETHWLEDTKGRPSVVGVVKGTGGGKSLMLNGHMDTVTTASYEGDPLSGHIKNGRLYGRGSADMKSGLAAALMALWHAKTHPLKGDVIFTGVADEEDKSIGTEEVLRAGWRADAAIVCEPTGEDLVVGHKGFLWFEVDINGRAAHGSRFDLGVDAISLAGYFLVEVDKYAKRLGEGPAHPSLGLPSVHASIIKGGEEPASYPAKCTIVLERRTVAGETEESVRAEVEALLQAAKEQAPALEYDLRITFKRNPFEIYAGHSLVSLVSDQIKKARAQEVVRRTEAFWTDCALISDVGIPVVMYGPHGEGLHAKEEWADVESIERAALMLVGVAQAFCGLA